MATATPLNSAQHDLHVFLEIDRLGADHVLRHGHLVVGLRIHEMVAVAVLVEEGEFAVLDEGALDLLGGLVAVGGLHAVRNAAHVDLGRRRALAGMEALRGQNDIELAIVALDDIALANRTCDDFHVSFLDCWLAAGGLWIRRPGLRAHNSDPAAKRQPVELRKPMSSRPPSGASPWWSPHVYADRRPFLKARERIMQAWRADFAARGFSEVETAILQVSPGNEAHIGAFATELERSGRRPAPALSACIAGIFLQETAGGRRKPHFHLRQGVPQRRARGAAPSRIHHARMVPGRRTLRRADRRLRPPPRHRRRGGGTARARPGAAAEPMPSPIPNG